VNTVNLNASQVNIALCLMAAVNTMAHEFIESGKKWPWPLPYNIME
jgi:hypothetical protein